MPEIDKLQYLWQIATEQIKKRITNIAVWRAMEAAVVLDCEEERILVLGLPGEAFSQSGHLTVPEHQNLIDQTLSQITQREMTFRVVECGSVAEWQTYKVAEERKRAAQLAMMSGKRPRAEEPKPTAAAPAEAPPAAEAMAPKSGDAARGINEILDRAYKLFAAQAHRTLSQSRARFVRDAAQMLAGAEGQLVAAGMAPDAVMRTIDRAIDKIAVWGECDATTVALEYLRCKDRG